MLPLDTWLLFCVACIALVATPGPTWRARDDDKPEAAAGVRSWFSARPGWGRHTRRALAGVFGALAARLVWQDRP